MYTIELITAEPPYILIGYWDAEESHISRLKKTINTDEDGIKSICRKIKKEYDGKIFMRLMPWVYEDGKIRHDLG